MPGDPETYEVVMANLRPDHETAQADLLADVFHLLAEKPTADRKHIARDVWVLMLAHGTEPAKMRVDEDLISLGLARRVRFERGGEVVAQVEYTGGEVRRG